MATTNTTTDTEAMPVARVRIAFDAIAEIEALIGTIRREAEAEADGFANVLRGMLLRMKDLTSVVASVLGGDDDRSVDEMTRVVFGDAAVNEAEKEEDACHG